MKKAVVSGLLLLLVVVISFSAYFFLVGRDIYNVSTSEGISKTGSSDAEKSFDWSIKKVEEHQDRYDFQLESNKHNSALSNISELSVGPVSFLDSNGKIVSRVLNSKCVVEKTKTRFILRCSVGKSALTDSESISILTSCKVANPESVSRNPEYLSWYSVVILKLNANKK